MSGFKLQNTPRAASKGIAIGYRDFLNPTTAPGTGTKASGWIPTDQKFDEIPNTKVILNNDGGIDSFRLNDYCRMFHVVDNLENYSNSAKSSPFEKSNIEVIYLSSSAADPMCHLQVSPGGVFVYIYSALVEDHFIYIKNKAFSYRGSKSVTIRQYAGDPSQLPDPTSV